MLLPRPFGQGPIPIPPPAPTDSPLLEIQESEMKKQVWLAFNKGYNDGFVSGYHTAEQRRSNNTGRGGRGRRPHPPATRDNNKFVRQRNNGQTYELAPNVVNGGRFTPPHRLPPSGNGMYKRVLSDPIEQHDTTSGSNTQ